MSNGIALGITGAGIIFLWAGVKGYSVTSVIQDIVTGKSPVNATVANAFNVVSATGPTAASIAAAGSSAAKSVTITGSGNAGSSVASYQAYAFSLFPQFGWGADQQAPLVALWNQESGWNPSAQNPTSTAYGIAQFLDSTWGPYGSKTSDPALQIKYGLEYISARYGSPAGAWAHERAKNWY